MKVQGDLMDELNNRLDEELAAVYQYMVHAEMCDILHFNLLSYIIQQRAFIKMRHAKILIAEILSYEGMPKSDRKSHFTFSQKVQDLDIVDMHQTDMKTEQKAIDGYNYTIGLADEAGINDIKVLLESFLNDDVDINNWIKAQLVQIDKMGLENYLSHQIGSVQGFDGGGGPCPGCHEKP